MGIEHLQIQRPWQKQTICGRERNFCRANGIDLCTRSCRTGSELEPCPSNRVVWFAFSSETVQRRERMDVKI